MFIVPFHLPVEDFAMRTLCASLVAAMLVATAVADDAKKAGDNPKKANPEPSLKVGDPAPALKADAWLHGTEVKAFDPGKVYVVEFWATWCGPCIVMMPHMADMQAEYKDKGVTFIGFSAKDPNNTKEKVTAFVEKRGPKLGYTFAYGDNRETYSAWMQAAGQNGIPCSFVVGKDGKIAYIGHPMFLDVVLPKVVDGTWKGADSAGELKKVEADVNDVFKSFNGPDAEAGLKALSEFEAKYPGLSQIPYFIGPKISLLLKAKKVDEAKKMAAAVMAKAVKQEDPMALASVSRALRSPEHKDLAGLSLEASLAGLKLAGDKDLGSLLNVADGYFATGDKAKAREYGAKAVEAATPQQKAAVERIVKKYEEEKKDEKKDEK
jgi:thiol-disulfide isomerase/thioredoxin